MYKKFPTYNNVEDNMNSSENIKETKAAIAGSISRARPGFEPGTSHTLSENHTPRPTNHKIHQIFIMHIGMRLKIICKHHKYRFKNQFPVLSKVCFLNHSF